LELEDIKELITDPKITRLILEDRARGIMDLSVVYKDTSSVIAQIQTYSERTREWLKLYFPYHLIAEE
jgi:hypothetical protein